MSDPMHATMVVFFVCLAVAMGWNVYVAFFNDVPNRRDTLSGITLTYSWKRQVWSIPYALGVIVGHLVLPRFIDPLVPTWLGLSMIIACAVVFAIIGHRVIVLTKRRWFTIALVLVLTGLGMGHLFWSQ